MRDELSPGATGHPAFLFGRMDMNDLLVDKFIFRVAPDYRFNDTDV
jgi:hypothetical protein